MNFDTIRNFSSTKNNKIIILNPKLQMILDPKFSNDIHTRGRISNKFADFLSFENAHLIKFALSKLKTSAN